MSIKSQINDFLLTGQFTNNIDEFGNVNLYISSSEANEQYIVFPLINFNYKKDEIENLYDVGITEIQTEPKIQKQVFDQSFLTEYNKVLYENQDLKEKLNQLVDEVQSDSSKSQLSAARDLIVQLRIKLKQGNKLEDFSNEFPFNLFSLITPTNFPTTTHPTSPTKIPTYSTRPTTIEYELTSLSPALSKAPTSHASKIILYATPEKLPPLFYSKSNAENICLHAGTVVCNKFKHHHQCHERPE